MAQNAAVKVGFQGQKGAYSEGAVLDMFGTQPSWKSVSVEPVGLTSFVDVFEAIKDDVVEYGLIPLENSSTGTFHFTYDLLLRYSLYIVGECQYHESHCLLGVPGTKIEDITHIKSHPYVIDQCRTFISSLGPAINVVHGDTASSAASIQSAGTKHRAAIAGARAAQLYGLEVLRRDIEDEANTLTRYILISRRPINPERHLEPRTSISLWLKNQVGMFHKAIAAFAMRDINICKIESRPSTRSIQLSKPWEYVLYIDIDGTSADGNVANAIKQLEEFATVVRNLGSYPRYQKTSAGSGGVLGIGM
ncbi:prephenate dehydratase [Phlyctochytrium arcticum]|nr:prephenate dehydratase [Phlyctochytrium arcticum]